MPLNFISTLFELSRKPLFGATTIYFNEDNDRIIFLNFPIVRKLCKLPELLYPIV